jgi:ribosomal protein S19
MTGFKFGEFTWTRKIALFKAKQLRKKKKKKKINEIWTSFTDLLNKRFFS